MSNQVPSHVVSESLNRVWDDGLATAIGVPGSSGGEDDWPDWVTPVAVSFAGVFVLFLALRLLLRAVKRVK